MALGHERNGRHDREGPLWHCASGAEDRRYPGYPIGTRIERHDYGSLWRELIDMPTNAATAHLLRAATALAIQTWETEFIVTKVILSGTPAEGNLAANITGKTDAGGIANSLLTLTIPLPTSR
jgi:phage baseplate assembly protein W